MKRVGRSCRPIPAWLWRPFVKPQAVKAKGKPDSLGLIMWHFCAWEDSSFVSSGLAGPQLSTAFRTCIVTSSLEILDAKDKGIGIAIHIGGRDVITVMHNLPEASKVGTKTLNLKGSLKIEKLSKTIQFFFCTLH